MVRSIVASIFTVLFCLSLGSPSVAQESKKQVAQFEFNGESLSEALDQIIQRTDLDLVYDPQLTEGVHIYKRISQGSTDDLLKRLLEDHELDYIILSSGTYVIVRSVRNGPFYGTFTGKIVDNETGEPLPGATVMLADVSGGTSANRAGNFSLNKLMTGTHEIIFSYVGYEPVYKTIEIKRNEKVTERIALDQKPVNVVPVVVEAHRSKMPIGNSPTVSRDTDLETFGVMRDAIRNLNLMTGVQYGLPMTDLHLQGGQQSEHRVLLDGVPVYNPTSFGQMFSSFSPYAIGKVTLHKAGYGVEEGSQIAGLIGLSHDVPSNGDKSVTLQGDPLSANLRGDLSFSTGDNSSLNLMTALRTNFWDIYKHPVFEQTIQNWNVIDPLITNTIDDLDHDASIYTPVYHDSGIRFFDYHLAGEYEIDPFNSVDASLYVAENSVETQLLNHTQSNAVSAPYLYANDNYAWKNLTTQISWHQMPTPRFTLTTQASYSGNLFEHQNRTGLYSYPVTTGSRSLSYGAYDTIGESQSPLPTQIDGNNIRHFILKTDGSYSISPQFSLQGGLQFDRILSGIDISDLNYLPARMDQSSTLFSSYVNSNHVFGNYWNLEWGSRFTYSALSNNLFVEPRLSVQFDQPESDIGYWSARFSAGLYRQFVNEYQITNTGPASLVPSFEVWSLSAEKNVPKAWHWNGSFLMEPAENTSLKLELFYKWQPVANITSYGNLNLPEEEQTAEGNELNEIGAFSEATKMKAFGGGLRADQTFANSGVTLTAGYDYSLSRVNMESQFGRELPAPWNQPHRGQFRALWRIVPNLAVMTRWQGIWGRKWAFRQSYYNFLRFRPQETTLPVSFDSPEDDKLSSFQQVDLSFIYQPSLGPADLEMRVELINLLNRKNTLEKYLWPTSFDSENQTYQIRHRHLPGFYPSVSIQMKF